MKRLRVPIHPNLQDKNYYNLLSGGISVNSELNCWSLSRLKWIKFEFKSPTS